MDLIFIILFIITLILLYYQCIISYKIDDKSKFYPLDDILIEFINFKKLNDNKSISVVSPNHFKYKNNGECYYTHVMLFDDDLKNEIRVLKTDFSIDTYNYLDFKFTKISNDND